MISAATASTAVLMISLVRDRGFQYLFAATVLMGLIQIVAGAVRLGLLMKFVSRSVMIGFVNALAILIFLAQLPQLTHVGWETYAMVAAGLSIIYLFPFATKRVPSALISIVVLTGFASTAGRRSPASWTMAVSVLRTTLPNEHYAVWPSEEKTGPSPVQTLAAIVLPPFIP